MSRQRSRRVTCPPPVLLARSSLYITSREDLEFSSCRQLASRPRRQQCLRCQNILGPLYALHGGTSETAGSISGLPGNPRVFCSVRLCDSGSRLPLACSCRFDFSREQYSWAPRTSIIRSLGSVRLCTSQSCASGLAARTARISSLRQTPYSGVIRAQSQQFSVPCLFPWDIGRQADPNAPS